MTVNPFGPHVPTPEERTADALERIATALEELTAADGLVYVGSHLEAIRNLLPERS